MMAAATWAILALAVSFDGFGVGLTYGARNIRIPFISVFIIAVCSALVMFLSMQLGSLLLYWISPDAARRFGAFILVGIGLWAVIQTLWQRNEAIETKGKGTQPASASAKKIIRIEIRRLGLVIEVLRRPMRADLDRSGNISSFEAVVLGAALSLDAFGAGIGAALVGLPALATASMIGAACGLFLYAGLKLGTSLAHKHWMGRLTVLPGLILIVLGVSKLF